jgi:hypothetical protein
MPTSQQLSRMFFIFGIFLFASHIHQFHYHPYRNFFHDGLVVLGILLAFSYLAYLPKVSIGIPVTLVLPLGLIIIIALQTVNGLILFPIDSVFPILYLLMLMLAMILGTTLVAQENGVEKLCFTLACVYLAVGLVSVIFQEIQLFGVNGQPFVMPVYDREYLRPYANLAQPNIMALVFCFSLASVWWLYVTGRLNAWMSLASVFVLFWGIALTQSRIAWIILPLFVLLCAQRIENGKAVSKRILLLLSLLFIGYVLLCPILLEWMGIMLPSLKHHVGQLSVRWTLWRQAWLISTLHPWFGAGWFQFGHEQAMLAVLFPTTEYSEYAHNTVLNFAAELGWPVTIAILVSVVYYFYVSCIQRWANLHIRFLSLIIVAIAAHSMVEFPLWHAIVLLPLGVIIGALYRPQLGMRVISISRVWIISLSLCSLISIGGITWDYYRVINGFDALMWQQARLKDGVGSTDKPEFTLFTQFYDYFHIVKIKIYPGMPAEDINFLERASLRFTYPPILMRLAMAYIYNQRPTEALQVLITIQRLHRAAYVKTYETWRQYAQQDPNLFKEVFKRMPKPDSNLVGATLAN